MSDELTVKTGITSESDVDRPIWELIGYKSIEEIESDEEWEGYVADADARLFSGGFVSLLLAKQHGKRATDVARLEALRRRLTKELKANTVLEQILVDLLVANYQQQCDWWELLGAKTSIVRRRKPIVYGTATSGSVEKVDFDELADRVVPLLDRLSRQFLRIVRGLRDLKNSPITLTVQRAEQINIGQQQINLAPSARGVVDEME